MGVPGYCPICVKEELFFEKTDLPNDSFSLGGRQASFYPFFRYHRRPDIVSGGGGRCYRYR